MTQRFKYQDAVNTYACLLAGFDEVAVDALATAQGNVALSAYCEAAVSLHSDARDDLARANDEHDTLFD